MNIEWTVPTEEELKGLEKRFQKSRRDVGVYPDKVFVIRNEHSRKIQFSAMCYHEPGKYTRWGLQHHPPYELLRTWSEMKDLLRGLIGDRAAIEVYPEDKDIIDSAPIRWFWLLPSGPLPFEFDLKTKA